MAEYIDRSAFLEQKRAWYCKNCIRRTNSKGKIVYEIGEAPCQACGIGDVLDDLEDVPAADVRPVVKATWEKVTEQPYFRKHYHVVACSACHKRGNQGWNFCPNCGCAMEETE